MTSLTNDNIQDQESVEITGSEAVIRSLIAEGVDTIFGYPGGAIMPVYDALYDYRHILQHVLTRHEQGAVHAAQGYARVSGKVGVCIATSGPGATNLITGIADALILAHVAAGTILVVGSGQTRRAVVRGALKRLMTARARLIGAVLNKFDPKMAGYGYGHGSGEGYGYGSYGYYAYGGQQAPEKLTQQ